jgi:hypothetical protein
MDELKKHIAFRGVMLFFAARHEDELIWPGNVSTKNPQSIIVMHYSYRKRSFQKTRHGRSA